MGAQGARDDVEKILIDGGEVHDAEVTTYRRLGARFDHFAVERPDVQCVCCEGDRRTHVCGQGESPVTNGNQKVHPFVRLQIRIGLVT